MASIATLLPNGEQTFVDSNGVPFNGGLVYMYVAPSTTTFKDTWLDRDKTILNTNPIVLDSAGRAIIFGTGRYRQVLNNQFGDEIWDTQVEAMLSEDDVTELIDVITAIYDLPVFFEGLPGAGEEFPIVNMVRNCFLPAGLTGTVATVDVNPTLSMGFGLRKNGISIGTITFSTSGVATIVFTSQVSFVSGDQFSIVAPAVQDVTGSGVAITIPFTVG